MNGALIQLERLLGLDGAPPPGAGIVYPDVAPQIDRAFQVLHDFGVTVTMNENLLESDTRPPQWSA